MPAKILAPRRILIALAVTLLLGSGTVFAAGFGKPTGALPETWEVPEPRVGDEGNYTYSFVPDDGEPTPDVPYLDFRRDPVGAEYAQDGSTVTVHRLQRWQWTYEYDIGLGDGTRDWTWGRQSSLGVASDGQGRDVFLETAAERPLGATGAGTDVAGVPVQALASEGQIGYLGRLYMPPLAPAEDHTANTAEGLLGFCGARNGLQGQEVRLDDHVPVSTNCALRVGGVDPARLTVVDDGSDDLDQAMFDLEMSTRTIFVFRDWKAVGTQDLAGRATVAFCADGDDAGHAREVCLWFARDIPYPVQATAAAAHGTHVLRLTGFRAGTGPIEFRPGPALAVPSPVVQAASQPYGMQDSGLGLRVTAASAWQAALDEGSLNRFLRDHPEAVLVEARTYVMRTAADGGESGWSKFIVADDAAAFGVQVRWQYDPVVAVPPALGLPIDPVGGEPSFEVEVGLEDVGLVDVPANGLPQQLPTVASLAQRLFGFTRVEAVPVEGWELLVSCNGDGEESGLVRVCDEPTIEVTVTAWDTALAPNSTQPTAPTVESTLAYASGGFDPAGTPQRFYIAAGESSTSVLPAALPPASQVPYEKPGNGDLDWSLPAAGLVATAGFIAILAGLAYLLWPLAKGGAFAGYARVTGQELLEHPQRQKLLACIEAQPGIHLKELARQSGMAWGQTQHHMAKLVSAGAVVAKPAGGYTCYFPKGQDRSTMGAAGVLKADGARRLFATIAGTQGLSMGQLSRAAGLTESTAHYHLKRLESAGLVSTHLIDGARRVTLTALGLEAGRRFSGAADASAVAAS